MSKEELYVIIQTTRIINSIKLFYTIAIDIKGDGVEDEVTAKKYIELLLHQAANLYEILYLIKKDLYKRYMKYLKTEETKQEIGNLVIAMQKNDHEIEILKAIRNKHSFHIAYDQQYLWRYIKEGPADRDVRIGRGNSIRENDYFYNMDIEPLFAFIKDNIIPSTLDVNREVKNTIDKYTILMIKLFNQVSKELIGGKIFGVKIPDEIENDRAL